MSGPGQTPESSGLASICALEIFSGIWLNAQHREIIYANLIHVANLEETSHSFFEYNPNGASKVQKYLKIMVVNFLEPHPGF